MDIRHEMRQREMRERARYNRNVPQLGKVIDFKYKGKKLSGKVTKTSKHADAFEVEANGATFLCDEWMGKFVDNSVIKTRKRFY
jgi:hypothetical protein